MSEKKISVFETLFQKNVNENVEKKKAGSNQLSYLSWSWAWAEVKKLFPDAKYEILKFESEKGTLLPYLHDEKTGYMVFTTVTIDNLTHEMWLPVMDGANKAMKDKPYNYTTKYNGEKTVEQASMFDVNKTIMRCLVKNLAMFGLGLYIYSGEDLPEEAPLPELSDKELIEKYLSQNPQNKQTVDEYLKTKSEHEVAEIMKAYIAW
ncbi:Prophage pi2 protein 11, topoisomerase [Lactococcus piscium]|nr:Prophage pi2 protein 11, topoisomerase [Lactococcus piscium]